MTGRGLKIQVIGVYLNDFLYKERGLTIKQATMVMMVLKLGTIIGQFAGAKIGQLAYNRRSMLQSILMGVSSTLALSLRSGLEPEMQLVGMGTYKRARRSR